ncbi:nuclear pore complex subunit Nup192 [Patellaria atrata CBS 101060]|uniref:Nuclear pore complex subunit Nup192 n=1 Tax=Patellaria atrata CBS 101060 TaxID=1346257 RepID=A0A9P4S320_9PEZI|nr:nuclear pore complex subunit Nup192 [Patellaria atrata CBS 101060]
MEEVDSLERLQGLYRDLVAYLDRRLPSIDRLSNELQAREQDFRKLLDRTRKSEKSRQSLVKDQTITVDEVEYAINDEFKQETVKLADELDLDEIQAAKLFLDAQKNAATLDRSPLSSAIIRFHQERQFLLECLRLVINAFVDRQNIGEDEDDPGEEGEDKQRITPFVEAVLGAQNGRIESIAKYWQKCFSEMAEIEGWLQNLTMQMQKASVLGGTIPPELLEIIDFQQSSLIKQHESLAAICTALAKGTFAKHEELRLILSRLKSMDRSDIILIHYVPVLSAAISTVASAGTCLPEDAKSIHEMICGNKENEAWMIRNLHAATIGIWLAEYSGRFGDENAVNADADQRGQQFESALKDGAFHFILSICQSTKASDWWDPARAGIVSFLLQETPILPGESPKPSEHFQKTIMEQFRAFTDSFISNMPDTLRKLKSEEDDQRRLFHSRFRNGPVDYETHLERFLLIMAFAYEGDPEAALNFWTEPEGNLFGFLQWAAKRQTTPRVAAFCELLLAISEGEECAKFANTFLVEEGPSTSGKLRRTNSLSWHQIFTELQFYAATIRDRLTVPTQSNAYSQGQSYVDQVVEPESAMMLECYLRLVAHLCRETSTTRDFIMNQSTFHLHEMLILLCSSSIDSRLRACAFNTLGSLLTEKSSGITELMWNLLDQWITGQTSNVSKPNPLQINHATSESKIFDAIFSSFEEANAFVSLLQALVAQYPTDSGLHDTLPFPENLGSAYRMPGIEFYIDFVVGRIFGYKSLEIQDLIQVRILQWNCLNLIHTCLNTFNEHLVIFANRANVGIDKAIESSSLSAYVRLHPFARVMEWVFNDKVLQALFAAAHQDVDEVNIAATNSPLIMSLVRSIQVMDLVMKLQSTYLDIVRPIVKIQSPNRSRIVSNSSLASFEDAILGNLQLVVDLGLYCGTGNQDLTIVSLNLLEKLASSRKLAVSPNIGFNQRAERSRLIAIMEKNDEAERISRALCSALELDPRELEVGADSPGYHIKLNILKFLDGSIAASPTKPTLAHLLLGFVCNSTTIDIADDSLFASGTSLFHSVLKLTLEYPQSDIRSFRPWMTTIRRYCIQILQKLWSSPLSSIYTLTELRSNEYLFVQFVNQITVGTQTPWDGLPITDPDFVFSESAIAFIDFLTERGAFYDYLSREIRTLSQSGSPTLKARVQSALLGTTVLLTGEQIPNPSIFDLFDVTDLNVPGNFRKPTLKHLKDLNFEISRSSGTGSATLYDLDQVIELITLKKNQLKKEGALSSPAHEQEFQTEAQLVLTYLHGHNQGHLIAQKQADVLESWAQLMTVFMQSSDFEASLKTSLILRAFQLILPKLEKSFSEDPKTALILADLSRALVRDIDFASKILERTKTGDYANDRLFQVFRASLAGVTCLVGSSKLREILYQVCYRYLRGSTKGPKLTGDATSKGSNMGRHSIRTIKLAGERLIETICDDAYAGEGTCKISALLTLDTLVSLAIQEESNYLIESFVRLNFIYVLVDSIKNIPAELQSLHASDLPLVLSYYDAALSLLLRISRTRSGAAHVTNAGLFQSVRDSQIFSVDPDLGLQFENPGALKKFFSLMLSVLQVINSVVLSRGPQNDQTIQQATQFLNENRHTVVAIFKRHARVGGVNNENSGDLSDLVDNFTLLIAATDFLEFEETNTLHTSKAAHAQFS